MSINVLGIKLTIKRETAIISCMVLLLLAMAAGYLLTRNVGGIEFEGGASTLAEQSSDLTSSGTFAPATENTSTVEEEREIKVYVVGCVKTPGIVTIKKGDMVFNAVEAAGGLTKNADPNAINMVYPLNENSMLYIKAKDEQKLTEGGETGKGAEIITDGRGVVSGSSPVSAASGGKVNINTADASELDTLPGIGEATAKDIIAFREKNGPYRSISDIMKVPRIKEGRFEKIKDFITVE